jgi:hypothetical protein
MATKTTRARKANPLACRYCGHVAKALQGTRAHERRCPKNPKPAKPFKRNSTVNAILAAMPANGDPMSTTDVAAAIGKPRQTISGTLSRLKTQGQLQRAGVGMYRLAPALANGNGRPTTVEIDGVIAVKPDRETRRQVRARVTDDALIGQAARLLFKPGAITFDRFLEWADFTRELMRNG